jgi:hypothetical protein
MTTTLERRESASFWEQFCAWTGAPAIVPRTVPVTAQTTTLPRLTVRYRQRPRVMLRLEMMMDHVRKVSCVGITEVWIVAQRVTATNPR